VVFEFDVGEGSSSLAREISSPLSIGGGREPLETAVQWDGHVYGTTGEGFATFDSTEYTAGVGR
jgi:hypothetical protein